MKPRKILCAQHRVSLRYRIDTDGNGGTADFVEPCPACVRPRFAGKSVRTGNNPFGGAALPKARFDDEGNRLCVRPGCDGFVVVPDGHRGRPPLYCPEHRVTKAGNG